MQRTALPVVQSRGTDQAFKSLIKAGIDIKGYRPTRANINAHDHGTDPHQRTALIHVPDYRHLESIQALLGFEATIEARDL